MFFEISAGAVVFYKKGTEVYYLLLLYPVDFGKGKKSCVRASKKSRLLNKAHNKEYWGLPKGRIEKGEKVEQTSRREIEEETGLKDIKFKKGFQEQEQYFFSRNKEKFFKKVFYLLAETKTKKIKISQEHWDFEWLPYKLALKKLTFKNAKNILSKAHKFLLKRHE